MKASIIVVTVFLCVFVVAFSGVVFPSRPALHSGLDSARLHSILEALYRRGYDGGTLFLDVRDSDAFLQIRKQIHSVGDVTLRSDFPLTSWSSKYYPQVKAYLDSAGIPYTDAVGSTDLAVEGAQPARTLVVSFGTDLLVAQRYVEFVVREILGVDPATHLVGTLENVAARDISIGFK